MLTEACIQHQRRRASEVCLRMTVVAAWWDFVGWLGDTSILHAKLMAIKKGLVLARTTGVQKLICHFDSKATIELIKAGVGIHHAMPVSWNTLGVCCVQSGKCNWDILWEGNSCADWLANEGARAWVSFQVWDSSLAALTVLLQGDMLEVSVFSC